MRDIDEQTPSERDEAIYTAWESGKTLRVLAREFGVSAVEAERAIDRVLPPFDTVNQMRAYKRELRKLQDLGAKYHALAMSDQNSTDFAHVAARINERICSMAGWSSVNIRLDPYAAQVKAEPSSFEKIREAVMRVARDPAYRSSKSNGGALAPPIDPSANGDLESGSKPTSEP